MSFLDKMKNRFQRARGRAKEDKGQRIGDPRLKNEGRKDRMAGGAKQVGERVKDAAKETRRTFRR